MGDINSSLTMEKERVVRPGIFYQPLHSSQDIGLRWKPFRILGIVRQDQNVLRFEAPTLCQVGRVTGTAILRDA